MDMKRSTSSEDCNHCSLAPLEDLDDNLGGRVTSRPCEELQPSVHWDRLPAGRADFRCYQPAVRNK